MKQKLLLVDGHNLLFQMFFGMPARIVGTDGKPIQGVLGFVGALLRILRMTSPTHVLILFDGEHENDRTKLDGAYKANRPDYSSLPDEKTPFSQLPYIYTALDFLNIAHTEVTDFETDDTIAAYVFSRIPDIEIVIASQDSDFFQLIGDTVTVLRYRGDKTVFCGTEFVRQKFGILPTQYADFKSLVGDVADHIRGIPGIGPKTAAKLLSQYKTLDGILAHTEEITPPHIQNALLQNTERVQINRQLITLNNRAALPFSPDEMRYDNRGLKTGDVLRGIGIQ